MALDRLSRCRLVRPQLLALFAAAFIGFVGCDDSASSPDAPREPAIPQPAENAGAASANAQATPVVEPTPSVPAEPTETDAEAAAKEPIDMYDLDYDEVNDRFLIPGTQTPYNGPVFSVFEEDNRLESKGMLKEGHEHGYWIEYYDDGVKAWEGNYIIGREDGFWRTYWENGTLESSGHYDNGSLTGRWTTFFDNGTLDSDGIYVDGVMDGDWKFYDEQSGEPTIIRFDKGREVKP